MEDKELKKRLKKIPDTDKNGEPIYKIDGEKTFDKADGKSNKGKKENPKT